MLKSCYNSYILVPFQFWHFFINGFCDFHVESDSIDLLLICEHRYRLIFFYLPKALIYQIRDPANSQKPRFVEVELQEKSYRTSDIEP